MDFLDFHKLVDKGKLGSGKLLIAEPFLSDPNFSRSVVLLCEHGEDGALGFILNSPTALELGKLLPDFYSSVLSVGHGGPVQTDTLHMLHRLPEVFGGNQVADGMYWGGSFEALKDVIGVDTAVETDVRLLVGYAGWSGDQLEKEIDDGSWLIADFSHDIVFGNAADMWKRAIQSFGKQYGYLANMPTDPQLN